MDILFQKSELRKIFKAKRAALSESEIIKKSQQINHNFIVNLLPKIYSKNCGKKFSLYFAANGEARTDKISEHFYQNQIIFSYPKIIQKNHPLDFILAKQNQALRPNQFFPKIIEPQDGEKIFPDFIILPLLAFDHNLCRLGMGGGFFDRSIELLKKRNTQLLTIGLAYEFQRLETALLIEKTDQRLDLIVTENNIFSANQMYVNLIQ